MNTSLPILQAVTIGRNDSLLQAQQLMQQKSIRHLIVIDDDGKTAGILSQRDVMRTAVSNIVVSGEKAQNAFLESVKVKEAMSSPVVSVEASASLKECASLMLEEGIGSLPVAHNGDLIGIITKSDILREFASK